MRSNSSHSARPYWDISPSFRRKPESMVEEKWIPAFAGMTTVLRRALAASVVTLFLATTVSDAQGRNAGGAQAPVVPQPARNANIPPATGPTVKALRDSLTVPQGFKVEYFATNLGASVRFMALGPDGAVYLSQPGRGASAGHVRRLADADSDGKADQDSVVLTGIPGAHGLAFHNGFLHVAGHRAVIRYKLDAKGIPGGAPDTLARYAYLGRGHSTRTVVFGKDGTMYVTVGSSCNICIEPDTTLAAVLRFDADGKNGKVYSWGLRNAVGMAVHPITGEIWVSTHERDNLQPDYQDLPSEEIDILRPGQHFGWPYCHDDKAPNPDAVVADTVAKGFCEKTLPPALKLQGHAAPLGMTFLNGATMFPDEYRGDMLLALHGSWNRSVPVAPTVVRVRVRDGKPVSYEEFITGWQTGYRGSSGVRWGRPVDVMVYKDGSVLISDDQKGAIYRVYR